MNVLVTGCAGFLGWHVAEALDEEGHETYGLDNLLTGRADRIGGKYLRPGCVMEPRSRDLGVSMDLVVHCAAIARSTWPNDDELWEHNVAATQAVLGWGVPVIFASSSVVGVPHTTTYARTKAVAERLVLGAGGTALRFCNIYGPGQSEEWSRETGTPNVLAAWRATARDYGTIRVDGDGTQSRHWLHVRDAAQAVVAAIANPLSGMWLDVCGERATLNEVLGRFRRRGVQVTNMPARPSDPHDIPQDPTPAKVLLGWEPTIGLTEGLQEVFG